MPRSVSLALLTLFTAVTGCENRLDEADPSDKTQSAESLCGAHFDGLVKFSDRCALTFFRAEQRDGWIAECKYLLELPGVSADYGSSLMACGAELDEQSCTFALNEGACGKLAAGDREAGAACEADEQCQSGACNADSDECGTCALRVNVGEPCDGDATVCNAESYCSEGGTCVAYGKLGERCDSFGEEGAYCGGRLSCIDGQCGELPKLGEACESTCADGICGEDNECVALPGENEPCYAGVLCNSGLRCEGAEQARVCKKATRVASGEKCDSDGDCQAGFCKRSGDGDGVCAVYAAKGAACSDQRNERCAPGLRCTASTCEELAPICSY